MTKEFVWAIDENGKPCKCFALPENRGKKNCKHKFHQDKGESAHAFFSRYGIHQSEQANVEYEQSEKISQKEIDAYAKRIDEICGQHVTDKNYAEVIEKLSPEQLAELSRIGFEAAPQFSLPISDEHYGEENYNNKIYFSTLPDYKIGGKTKALQEMFGSIGSVPTVDGETYDIGKSNYRDGLTPRQYFEKQFSTRNSQINKSVSTYKPGETARYCFYGLADLKAVDDCGNKDSKGILDCKFPGGICRKCAKKSGWNIDNEELIGGIISTQLTEGLTQASLNAIHTGDGKKNDWEVVKDTLQGFKTSPYIKKALDKKLTTEEARHIIFEGLKESYKDAGIGIDDYNLEVVAKQLTSFKKDEETGELRYVKEGERCDHPSITSIGGHNNILLQSLLSNSYKNLTSANVYKNDKTAVSVICD